ncbi:MULTISPECIES: O-antigen ligase family protein [Pseudoalteromonas]|uniref:O-antigen ligase family protein n=1 Tax=Pseudoalteromonas TaxID=53246 RepID=UPI000C328F4E|nr:MULTISPECIES: O-antigen ligase family protein [Pseudoalteromonas]PKG65941.1 hypothetical protein CXF75_06005 [Pseudoalteromonas arctica]PKG70742.1 hypothetical protein CXF64_09110 [Pseudoalteromonas sp. GutCa3]
MFKNRLFLHSPALFFILFFRASLDPVLEFTKIGGIGLGALLNLLVVVLFFICCKNNKFVLPKSFLYVWGAFICIGLASIIVSPDKVQSLRSFFSILTYWAMFCFVYFFVKDDRDLKFFLRFTIYSSIVPFIFVFFELLFPEGSTTRNGFRLFGSFSHPNIFAFYLVLITTLCFFCIKTRLFIFSKQFIRRVKIILFISLICLVMTKTRSAWLALIIMFSVYALLVERRYLLYLFLSLLILLLIPEVQDRVLDIFSGSGVDSLDVGESLNSYEWRKVVWFASWDYIAERPFLGHGYDTFSYYFLDFFPLEESKGFDAHNAYVQITFDMGFLGLLAYLLIFTFILKRLLIQFKKDKRGTSIIIGLVISYLVAGYSDNMLFYLSYNWYFWGLLGGFFFKKNSCKRAVI